MSLESRRRFAALVQQPEPDLALACLLLAVEAHPDLDVDASLERLDALAAESAGDVVPGAPAHDVALGLRHALGDKAGFRGYGRDYEDLRGSLLHEVLDRRRGLPILLSIVYVEVARRLGVRVDGIGLAGHFLVGVPDAGGPVLLDPFYGGRLTTRTEVADRLTDDGLEPWDASRILLRVLANVRAVSSRADANRVRLWATELSLLVPGADQELRRERGRLLARLGDFVGAARELETYAELVAPGDPEAAGSVMREARMARARLS